ncbi:beta propeller repeat protein [Chitinophaga japonensis]|uniref:Photosystem II stability/assembly factor-like uncharacterized protein n=1 Tax=Chitinophaga japonensis TaxID=104662 RepID=A0A562T6N4_CHIJA|nr:oxidoreductase [Chitinophaga japonensis]TWI89211.1 photosystem II stability/assembly factor-like uncharacterized protein [Chitinophaga japonensis]
MLKKVYGCVLCCCLFFLQLSAQQKYVLAPLPQGPLKSIRGLCVLTDSLVWASGTGGMVGKSTDGGRQWQWVQVPGCDSCDWRDITAFNEQEALVINAGEPAHIFVTTDGGATWQRVYYNDTKGIFFDAMDFRSRQEGLAIGDPLEGRFTLLSTQDGGRNWRLQPDAPVAATGEALFAASGSGLYYLPGGDICFATGGLTARFFRQHQGRWQSVALPILQGRPSTGVFSIAFRNSRQGVAVGGDYSNDTLRLQNCALTSDGGRTWMAPLTPPGGYRSSVCWTGPHSLIATGTSGTDVSADGGQHWQLISKEGYHVVQRARKGTAVFLAGAGGRLAKLVVKKSAL